jgi:hypothetical protein
MKQESADRETRTTTHDPRKAAMADATSDQLRVRLVTPERTLFEAAAAAVELPA